MTRRSALVTLGRLAVGVVAVIALAIAGRPATPRPEYHPTHRPATPEEQARHDLDLQWRIEQAAQRGQR